MVEHNCVLVLVFPKYLIDFNLNHAFIVSLYLLVLVLAFLDFNPRKSVHFGICSTPSCVLLPHISSWYEFLASRSRGIHNFKMCAMLMKTQTHGFIPVWQPIYSETNITCNCQSSVVVSFP